jgi:hypothetical protein
MKVLHTLLNIATEQQKLGYLAHQAQVKVLWSMARVFHRFLDQFLCKD